QPHLRTRHKSKSVHGDGYRTRTRRRKRGSRAEFRNLRRANWAKRQNGDVVAARVCNHRDVFPCVNRYRLRQRSYGDTISNWLQGSQIEYGGRSTYAVQYNANVSEGINGVSDFSLGQ